MAITETRPFRTPAPGSVSTTLAVVSPYSEPEAISEVWNSGDEVVIRGTATLAESFWVETTISPDEDVWLVCVASCTPARSRWRAQSPFGLVDGVWTAALELGVDGNELAVELAVDLWIVGPGRTASQNPAHAVHKNAKLWQLPTPMVIRLEREGSDFPTSAASFSETGRREVPWVVETAPDAEPHSSISSSIRLFVNTDLDICRDIVDGTARDDLYTAIECDIHLAVLHLLGGWRDSVRVDRMLAVAEDDQGTMAALGRSIVRALGLTLDEGCRLACEDPITLASRSREALGLYRKSEPK